MKSLFINALFMYSGVAVAEQKQSILFDAKAHCQPDPFMRGVYNNCKMETQEICMSPELDPFLEDRAVEHAIQLELDCDSLDPRFEFEIKHNEVPLQALRPNKTITYSQLVHPNSTNCYSVSLVSMGPVKSCSLHLRSHTQGSDHLLSQKKNPINKGVDVQIRILEAYSNLEETLINYRLSKASTLSDLDLPKYDPQNEGTEFPSSQDLMVQTQFDFDGILEFSDQMYGKNASFSDLQKSFTKNATLEDVFDALLKLKMLLFTYDNSEKSHSKYLNNHLLKIDDE